MKTPRLFLSACEPSGDLHGAELAEQLLAKWPDCILDGVGGSLMRQIFTPTFDQQELAVMGFADVFSALPRLFRNFYRIKHHLLRYPPDIIITIDYPVGHLLLMRHLKRCGIATKWLHCVAPSMWVKGRKRLKILQKYADHLAVIFPHEAELLRPYDLPCTFIGNPVQRKLALFEPNGVQATCPIPIIALFPGSRLAEIERNLPLLLRVGNELKGLKGQLKISCCREKSDDCSLQQSIERIAGNQIALIYPKQSQQLMQECSLALAVSGTICLELALLQVPTCVIYCLGGIDWFIARFIVRLSLPFYSLPNLLANQRLFPEFFGKGIDEQALLKTARSLLEDNALRKLCRSRCQQLQNDLAAPQATPISQIADTLLPRGHLKDRAHELTS